MEFSALILIQFGGSKIASFSCFQAKMNKFCTDFIFCSPLLDFYSVSGRFSLKNQQKIEIQIPDFLIKNFLLSHFLTFFVEEILDYFSQFDKILELDMIQRENGSKYGFIIFKTPYIGIEVTSQLHVIRKGLEIICEIAQVTTYSITDLFQKSSSKVTIMLLDSAKKSLYYSSASNCRFNTQNPKQKKFWRRKLRETRARLLSQNEELVDDFGSSQVSDRVRTTNPVDSYLSQLSDRRFSDRFTRPERDVHPTNQFGDRYRSRFGPRSGDSGEVLDRFGRQQSSFDGYRYSGNNQFYDFSPSGHSGSGKFDRSSHGY